MLDISESMTDKLEVVQIASCGFLDELNSEDLISVYAFNHALRRMMPVSRDHDRDGV